MMKECRFSGLVLFASLVAFASPAVLGFYGTSVQPDRKRGVVNFTPPKVIEAAPEGFSGKSLLATADFDEDGMPDLVVARVGESGTTVSMLSGNVRSIHPNASIDGVNVPDIPADQPFFRREGIADTSLSDVAAEFVGAGDFNVDGHRDVVLADNKCQCLVYLLGDGKGGFPTRDSAPVGFNIRVLKVAEVNRYDGLEDVVLGVDSPNGGGAIIVYESPKGALPATPEAYLTKNQISDLSIGTIDKDHLYDIAVSNGSELTVIWGRDRKLTWEPEVRTKIPRAEQSAFATSGELTSVAIANFRSDEWNDIVTLNESGELVLFEGHRRDLSGKSIAGNYSADSKIGSGRFSSAPVDCLLFSPIGGSNATVVSLENGADKPNIHAIQALSTDSSTGFMLSMRLNTDAMDDLVTTTSAGIDVLTTAPLTAFVVTNTNSSGTGSFAQAVVNANANPGADVITFNIPGTGPHLITLIQPIVIADPVEIDGTSQPEFSGSPLIEIKQGFLDLAPGLTVSGGNSRLHGLRLRDFFRIQNDGGGGLRLMDVGGNIIDANVFGAASGDLGRNFFGVEVTSNGNLVGGTSLTSSNIIRRNGVGTYVLASGVNTVQGNKIIGNTQGGSGNGIVTRGDNNGLLIGGTAPGAGNSVHDNSSLSPNGFSGYGLNLSGSGMTVQGNLIGADSTGTTISTQVYGITVVGGESNLFGGTVATAANVIGGNEIGIILFCKDPPVLGANEIQGNHIGVGQDGIASVPNSQYGILIGGCVDTLIGGDSAAGMVRNIVSSNGIFGIVFSSNRGGTNFVQSNLIGLTASYSAGGNGGGSGKTGNGGGIGGGASSGTIKVGGTHSTQNTISANIGDGIRLDANGEEWDINGFLIYGNNIGTLGDGSDGNVGNTGNGVYIGSFATANIIRENRIAFNGLRGVQIPTSSVVGQSASSIEISQNEIFDNGRLVPRGADGENGTLNIDLGDLGQTNNDPDDPDQGGNGLQNFPLIDAGSVSNGEVSISGRFNSLPFTRYRIEFFYTSECSGDMPTSISKYLGATIVETGLPRFLTPYSVQFAAPIELPANPKIQAVAINDPLSGISAEAKNTSEYSPCFAATYAGTPTPTPTSTPTTTPTATPTSTPTATPSPSSGFEGDVSPRPQGDGVMNSTDVIQIRRFASALDTPNPAFNEAQRADCAPRATRGDGQLNSADVIQVRRYASGLDPIEPAGGELLAPMDGFISTHQSNRVIPMLTDASRVSATHQIVTVRHKRSPTLSGSSFTIEFDPLLLRNPRIQLPTSLEGVATLTANLNEVARGKIGVLIDSETPFSPESDDSEVLTILFDSEGTDISEIKITGSLVPISLSDDNGKSLPVFEDGSHPTETGSFDFLRKLFPIAATF